MFLDSAALRSSIVSHAKTMGYEVSSARAANATISVSIKTSAATITMPAGTKFASTLNGSTYNFVTIADMTGSKFGNSVNFDSINVYEGTYVETRYTADSSDLEQRFLLRDNRSDTSTLTVKVINSASDSTTTTYTKATDITQLTSSSTVYFLQEVEAGKFEVYFGDGIVSKAIEDGNIVSLSYVVTNKSEANGAAFFSPPSSIDGNTDITTSTIMRATGGAEPESLSSIKLSAPLNYAAQGRAVTTSDYETYVKKLFPNRRNYKVLSRPIRISFNSLSCNSTRDSAMHSREKWAEH